MRPVSKLDDLRITRAARIVNVRVTNHVHKLCVDAKTTQYGWHHSFRSADHTLSELSWRGRFPTYQEVEAVSRRTVTGSAGG